MYFLSFQTAQTMAYSNAQIIVFHSLGCVMIATTVAIGQMRQTVVRECQYIFFNANLGFIYVNNFIDRQCS